MSVRYSLRFKPNWAPSYAPQWVDVTEKLLLDQLPSISITAERTDVPLTATASDFSAHVNNSDNTWDNLFDTSKIVGGLPPASGSALRAPIMHFGKVMFCRKSDVQTLWEVLFVGFVDPTSIRFGRLDKTCTFTAYAVGNLLQNGNAERVNKIAAYAPAAPFIIQTGSSYLQHPTIPPGGTTTDNSWWVIPNVSNIPLSAGDQFQAVREVTGWSEGLALTTFSDDVYNIATVVISGGNTYIQTKEAPDLILGTGVAVLDLLTPWFRGHTWESLVQALVAEVNAALIAGGVTDQVNVLTTGLPLLPVTSQLFAQLIFMGDVNPPISGVSYNLWVGKPHLLISTQLDNLHASAAGKADILAPFDIGPVTVGAFNPGTIAGYTPGPDDGLALRILSPNLDLGTDAQTYDAVGGDVSLCGQSIHSFSLAEIVTDQNFDSTHWSKSPASYKTFGGSKTFYRIYARGRWVPTKTAPGTKRGIAITRFTSPDSGGTWVIESTHDNFTFTPLSDPDFDGLLYPPLTGPSNQPDFKCFQLAAGSYLYCWTDPYKGEAYAKTSTTGVEEATFFFPPPTSFINPTFGIPTGASGFVTEREGGNVFFFCDRQDGNGTSMYYWNGSAMVIGDFNNAAANSPLRGGDFINAIFDTSRHKFYCMAGDALYVAGYVFSAPALIFPSGFQAIAIDQVNYDQAAESQANAALRPGAIAWLTGPVVQKNAGEPDYTDASDSLIVASNFAIYIVSNVAANLVDFADFSGLSCAGALAQLIVVRGYQMISGADQQFVADPTLYDPIPTVSFRERLVANPSVIDLSALTEGCDDGIWLQNYVAVGVGNSLPDPPLGPYFNQSILVTINGGNFTINPPRNPASAALVIDNRFLGTASFAQLLANIYAQQFLIPLPDATVVIVDPYVIGQDISLNILDVIKYLKGSADDTSSSALFGQGRIFSITYGLAEEQITVTVN